MLAVGLNDVTPPPVGRRDGLAAWAVRVDLLAGDLLVLEAGTLRGAEPRLFWMESPLPPVL